MCRTEKPRTTQDILDLHRRYNLMVKRPVWSNLVERGDKPHKRKNYRRYMLNTTLSHDSSPRRTGGDNDLRKTTLQKRARILVDSQDQNRIGSLKPEIHKLSRRYPDEWKEIADNLDSKGYQESSFSLTILGRLEKPKADLTDPLLSRLFDNNCSFFKNLTEKLTGKNAATIMFRTKSGDMVPYQEMDFAERSVSYKNLTSLYEKEWGRYVAIKDIPLAVILDSDNEPIAAVRITPREKIYADDFENIQNASGSIPANTLLNAGKLTLEWMGDPVKKDKLINLVKSSLI